MFSYPRQPSFVKLATLGFPVRLCGDIGFGQVRLISRCSPVWKAEGQNARSALGSKQFRCCLIAHSLVCAVLRHDGCHSQRLDPRLV